jgi:uncharacterized protein YndB with AHSA1/START domain
MHEMGVFLNSNTVRFQRLLPGTAERVWDCITKSEHLAAWLMTAAGISKDGLIEFDSAVADPKGVYHRITGVVSEFEPPRVLAYSWFEPAENASTFVRWELEERGHQVLLTLTHSALQPEWMPLVGAGWHIHLERLIGLISGEGQVEFDQKTFTELIQRYTVALAATGLIVVGSASSANAETGNTASQAMNEARHRLLSKYDRLWKDADDLRKQIDALNKVSATETDRALDDLDREYKYKIQDLRQIEFDIRDVDKAML